ncbi:MAG: phosphoribosylformylglycinamidine synthase subunit PurL [Nitrospinae bacterium]|nr:phosphoribosylformylglycinamidine synthase subunit PurL [Nitrospinota bacterium]
MEITKEVVKEHGLTEEEYEKILEILERKPNYNELGIFSVMWSEHCSYKSSRVHLRNFHTEGKQVILGPGENAGVVDIGDGLGIVFKMESHNHPSFIEPFQGAATGVGGIMRDIFTMGARPIASLNLLRFGQKSNQKTGYLVRGVSAGISHYGNCMGIPTIAGETFFDASYDGNNLVNAMTLGLVEKDKIFTGSASGVGNKVYYIGSKTGRDGIHGATMASASFTEETEEKRPTVQVGDPFAEKVLLEAVLELMESGAVEGIQDMGAAGLTSSSIEMADRAGNGIRINLDNVPQREENMTPYEIMLSESQERMLVVIKKGMEKFVSEIIDKWDIAQAEIGEVTDTGRIECFAKGERVMNIPIKPLVSSAPVLNRPIKAYSRDEKINIPLNNDENLEERIYEFIGSVNLCSKRCIYSQYDYMVGTDTVNGPENDSGIVKIKGTTKGVAVTTDSLSRYCFINPYEGGKHTVAEAARNIASSGAKPLAITDCMNFGNPEVPEVMYQFAESVKGITEACIALDTPVVSGNVSFYNETNGVGIYPTPGIGMVGLIEDVTKAKKSFFTEAGQDIYMTGTFSEVLDGSEYASYFFKQVGSQLPELDLKREMQTIQFILEAVDKELVTAVHDVAIGGLIKTLLTSLFTEDMLIGAEISNLPLDDFSLESILFGEVSGRFVFTADTNNASQIEELANSNSIPLTKIGSTNDLQNLTFTKNDKTFLSLDIKTAFKNWNEGLSNFF